MKELTIEEKAKAYDRVVKEVKDFFEGKQKMYSDVTQTLEHLFPELAKSEDVVIKEKIIATIHLYYGEPLEDEAKEMIAWLEKQGEQKPCMIQWKGDNLKEVIDFTGKDKNFEKWFKSFEEYKKYVDDHNGIFKLFNADGSHYEIPVGAWIVKTPDGYNIASKAKYKQKSADKVEPKFHEGDWVVRGDTIAQILDIQEQYYIGIDTNGNDFTSSRFLSDGKIHLWTIQDAKDGDVLTVNNEVFIYAHRKQLYSIAVAHCFVDSAGGFYLDGEFGYTEKGNSIHPATKEQRYRLKKAMVDAGYTFDSEKKELKKIEQKTAWSEEDEKMIDAIYSCVDSHYDGLAKDALLIWLKSLRPQSHWKPSDNKAQK